MNTPNKQNQTLADIRRTFIDFFVKNGHENVSSSPLVPQNDPTLLFTNAGMVQFKDVFTGKERRPYNRAVTSQKCLRAGGKHNDLDNVGYTARHHTFFEMLGNFSFGDYFKEQAIAYAWDLVTKELCLDPKRLLVTVYADDTEAATLWRKIAGFSDDRIIRIATSDNFWSMGDTGPCGPCSEIFYDHGDGVAGGPPGSADQDGDRFVEIWNLVFMQFDQQADGSRMSLPNPSIDTGMGLERVAAVLQGVHNNYDTDLFREIIAAIVDLTGQSRPESRHSYNVIADHLRASCFLMADGVLPSNDGRGYVLRRIMRRGMRHAHLLGARDPLFWQLVPTLIRLMGDAYPELLRAQALIQQTLKQEEEKFHQTLDRGLKLLNESTVSLPQGAPLSGEVAFKLYDTYGFPLDLTQDVLKAEGRLVDVDGFQDSMNQQKAQARSGWVGSGDAMQDKVWFDLKEKLGATEFLGYATLQAEGVITAILGQADQTILDEAGVGATVMIVTNQTPFYAESGGQAGDQGVLETDSGAMVRVSNTQKKVGSLFVHVGYVMAGSVHLGDAVTLRVDSENRRLIAANHSATHLLHAALRQILGQHVAQKGSLVSADRLRFDFTHPRAVTADELKAVQDLVNGAIRTALPAQTRLMTPDQAVAEGAMALFGERYGDEVRVVSMGDFSVELCGGTHVQNTGDIGLYMVVSENGVSSGVRRIEAITGTAIIELLNQTQGSLLLERDNAKKQVTDLQKQVADLKRSLALKPAGTAAEQSVTTLGAYRAAIRHLTGVAARDLKAVVDDLKKEIQSGIVIVTSVCDDKVSLVVGVTDDLTDRISAVDLARIGAETLGGKGGGGRPDLAQAGGNDLGAISRLIRVFQKFVG
ncbi:MAG: alanine--tRNA ligase [Alphaproteobacteria bacterium]|nr:alanine--tRNA ligase [Alphaproteobacteria bacterium]